MAGLVYVGPVPTPSASKRVSLAWVGLVGVLACVPVTRNEPTLDEKCEQLAMYCDDLPDARDDLAECQKVGAQGVKDEDRTAECFVAYDRCIDECLNLYQLQPEATDAGS